MKINKIFEHLLDEDFKSQKKRFISQGIDPEIVNSYMEKFKHIKDKKYREMFDTNLDISVAPDKRNNIDAYTDFHDLEQLVDYVGSMRQGVSNFGGSKEEIEVDGKPVYKDDTYEVYYADTPRACIKYKGKFPYSWCVARSDSSNMFYTYRFKPYEPAFYFIKNKPLTEKEFGIWNMTKNVFEGKFKYKYHFFVIQVPKNVKPDDNETQQYIVSSANNDGDTQMSWNEILKISPNIGPIKEVLQPKPFTPEEREKNERFKNGISDEEFRKLSYEDKRSYLDIYPTIARPISYGQLTALPDDLLNLYVSFGIGLTDEQFAFIKPKKEILKRYSQISKRKLDQYLQEDGYRRRQLRMNFTELIVLDDKDITKYLDSLSQSEINEFIKNYGEDKFEFLEKHLPHRFTDEYKSLKQVLIAANSGEQEAIEKVISMIPSDVEVEFRNNHIRFDLYSYGSYLKENLDESLLDVYDKIGTKWYYDYDDYFDGYQEGLDAEYTSILEHIVQHEESLSDTFKKLDLTFNVETIKDLLETYNKHEEVEDNIRQEFSEAKNNAEGKAWDDISNDFESVIYMPDYNTISVNLGPFIMFLTRHKLFSTDKQEFIANIINILETLPSDYGLPTSFDKIWEDVREDGYNHMNVDNNHLVKTTVYEIEKALELFTSEDDEVSTNVANDEKEAKVAKLKSQIIGSLDKTLQSLGQDPKSSFIENDMVSIQIDRQKFKLSGQVYIRLTDKKTKKYHDGYVNIKDIPSYFQNYKLFEQLSRISKLMRY